MILPVNGSILLPNLLERNPPGQDLPLAIVVGVWLLLQLVVTAQQDEQRFAAGDGDTVRGAVGLEDVQFVPDLLALHTSRMRMKEIAGIPFVSVREEALSGVDRIVKRSFDVVATGLGLLVIYRVVCAHGGHVNVLSDEDVGTVFTIIIPLPEQGPLQ